MKKEQEIPSIRRNQVITNFGPGAIVDFPNQSLMGCNIEEWGSSGEKIHDHRLEKKLNVNHFRLSPDKAKIPYIRFPKWHFCVQCREFKEIDQWKEDYEQKNDNKKWDVPRCASCNHPLVPSRFIVICNKGHIDDFPWVDWVHRKKGICNNPKLTIKTADSTSGLEGIQLKCTNCGAKTTMKGAYDKDALSKIGYKCKGNKPWEIGSKNDNCEDEDFKDAKFITAHRGGSNVYFSKIISSIYIPVGQDPVLNDLENTSEWNVLKTNADQPEEIFESLAKPLVDILSTKINLDKKIIQKYINKLKKEQNNDENEEKIDFHEYRYQEYSTFLNHKINNDANFSKEIKSISNYQLPWLRDIVLIKKLREVRTLIGFTRVNPPESKSFYENDEEEVNNSKLVYVKKNKSTDWYPAIEVKGEGIFITIREEYLKRWSSQENVQKRVKKINDRYLDFTQAKNKESRRITPEFVLLHTLSHLLIRELSFYAGYGSASLRERIYCNETDEQSEMKGILIYTSSGDSDGSLGGLVRLGRPEFFNDIFYKAIEKAEWCSNDPICIDSEGQGLRSLNLAACHACSLIPETSCEEFNQFLDRALLIGIPEDPTLGFFNNEYI